MMFRFKSALLLCCLCITQQVQAETKGEDQLTSSSAKQQGTLNPPADPGQKNSQSYNRYNPCASPDDPCSPAYEALTEGMTTYASKARDEAIQRAKELRKLFGAKSKAFGKWAKFGRAGELLAKKPGQVLSEFPNIVSGLVSLSEGDIHGAMQDGVDVLSGAATEYVGSLIGGFLVGGPAGAALGAMGGSVVSNKLFKPAIGKMADEMADRRSTARSIHQQKVAIEGKFKQAHQLILQALKTYNDNEAKLNKLRADMSPVEAEKAFKAIHPQMKKSRALCKKAISWDELKTQLNRIDNQVVQLQERLGNAGYFASETCRLANSMNPASQQDAFHMWDSNGKTLVERARSNKTSIKETFARIQQQWTAVKQHVSAADNASGAAIETLFNLGANKQEMLRQQQELASLDFSTIQANILQAIDKRERARSLIASGRKLQGLNPRFLNPDASKQYPFDSLFKSLEDYLDRQQDSVEETKAKAIGYERNIGRALSWITKGESDLDACANFSFNFDAKHLSSVKDKVSGITSAVSKQEKNFTSTEQCIARAQSLLTRQVRETDHQQPAYDVPLTDLVTQAQNAIASCEIQRAGSVINTIANRQDAESKTQAAKLLARLELLKARKRAFSDQIQRLKSLILARRDKGQVLAATKDMAKAGMATGCPDDKASATTLVIQTREATVEIVKANQESMKQGIYSGQNKQHVEGQRRQALLGTILTTLTGLQKIHSPESSPAYVPSTSGLPSSRSNVKEQPNKKATCMVESSALSMQSTADNDYWVLRSNVGTVPAYKIVSMSNNSRIPPGAGVLRSFETLREARQFIDSSCPPSQRAVDTIRY
jgi:hypothetical protein